MNITAIYVRLLLTLSIVLFVFSMISCQKPLEDVVDNTETSVGIPTDSEIIGVETEEAITYNTESPNTIKDTETLNEAEIYSKHELKVNEIVKVAAVELTDHKLSYVQLRSDGGVRNENAIRDAFLYSGNHYYYGEFKDNTAVMTLYDLVTNEIMGSFEFPFVVYEEVFLETNGRFFMAPCYRSNGILNMMVIMYDIEKKHHRDNS